MRESLKIDLNENLNETIEMREKVLNFFDREIIFDQNIFF